MAKRSKKTSAPPTARNGSRFDRIFRDLRRLYWLIGASVLVLTVIGFLGRVWWVFDMAAHFRLQYAAILAGWALLAWLLFGKRWAAVLFGLGFAVNAVLVAPYLYYPDNQTGHYRIISANVHFLNPDLTRVERYLLRERPDFVILLETPKQWRYKMPGLVKAYPYCYETLETKRSRIVLCSRFRPEKVYPLRTWDYNPGLFAEYKLEGRNFTLVGIHPSSTRLVGRDPQDRLLQYRQLAFFFTQVPPGELMVVGDFNTTPWSYYFRLLTARTHFYNTMRERGLRPSWPVVPLLMPALQIDNCIHTGGVAVKSLRTGPNLGSDHYPLQLEFDLIRPQKSSSGGTPLPGPAMPR